VNQLARKVYPLVNVVYTDNPLEDKAYRVDDVPDFSGIRVEGVYRKDASVYYDGLSYYPAADNNTSRPIAQVPQSNFTQEEIKLTNDNGLPSCEWAWVFNSPTPTGGGTGFQNQDYGVLIRIGSWGQFDGTRSGTNMNYGLRIPVGKINQVTKFEISTQPNFEGKPIFFDDPTLIEDVDQNFLNARGGVGYYKWVNTILEGTEFTVTYRAVPQKPLGSWN